MSRDPPQKREAPAVKRGAPKRDAPASNPIAAAAATMSSIVSDRRGVDGWVPTNPLQSLSLISGGRVEVDGGGGGVGAGELASPSVSSASAQLELMCRVAETHMNSQEN